MADLIKPAMRRASTWWMALLVVTLSFTMGYTLYLVRLDASLQKLAGEHNYLLGQASSLFSAELGDVRQSTLLLNTHLQEIIRSKSESISVSDAFSTMGKAHPNIAQIRWLSLRGNEIYRVNFDETGAVVTPDTELQNKSQRDYFKQATHLQPGELLLSHIDLNVENGQVQIPYEPTIRGILRTSKSHPLGSGFLVVNISLSRLFKELKNLSTDRNHLIIGSSDNRWLLHYQPFKEWSPDLNNAPHNLEVDKPELYRTLTEHPAVAMFRNDYGDIYSGHKLALNADTSGPPSTLYFLVKTQREIFSQLHRAASLPAIALAMTVFVCGGLSFIRELRNKLTLEALSRQLEKDKKDLAISLEREKLLQNELVEAERMASLGILVAGVSHELSTPIGGAIISVSSIQQRTHEIEKKMNKALSKRELQEYLTHCEQSSLLALENLNRSGDLIKRFKRLAVDRGNEESASFDLSLIVDDLVRSLGPLLKKRQTNISVAIPENIAMMSFPGILSQVLQNLITNCIDHAMTDQKPLQIYMKAFTQGEQVIVTVRDNGAGISESVRHRIFEPFITTSRGQGNTGLGLHLVHQWVNMVLEGQISFDSSSEGTVFILTLPQNVSMK